MDKYKENIISRIEFLELNEKDVMFITNPGRMGDEDGSTFVIKKGNEYIIYRIDGWMYPRRDTNEKELITLEDAEKQFPKWLESWKHSNEKDYNGKYTYLYMGFGNGLSTDNCIYKEYEPYLNKLVEEYLANRTEEEKETLKYSAIYSVWKKALVEMIENQK